jgi:hypothetical protein
MILFLSTNLQAQNQIEKHSFRVNELSSEKFGLFFAKKIKNTQFIMLGEQHGIKEVGEITNKLYNLAKPEGYNTLCIETSPFAANILNLQFTGSKKPENGLQKLYQEYPFAIPFYNNKNDVSLLKNIINNNGKIWGIDQVFMAEFRLVFDYFVHLSDNKELKKEITPLLKEAKLGFEKAIKEKNMMAPFIFKYSDDLHNKLLELAKTDDEKNIINDLKLTKEIYMYNFQKQFYTNNNERAKLMKRNFLNYYNEAKKTEDTPKVLFKLGANHAGKGFNSTNVLDISSLVSELAIINTKKSLHIYAMGINGTKNLGNPFVPVSIVPFDNSKDLPKELTEVIKNQEEKYLVIDASQLRSKVNSLSGKMKELVLKYDVLIYIKSCEALEKFN